MNSDEANTTVERKMELAKRGCAVIPENTQEFAKCFAVYYQSIAYIKSKNDSIQPVGHGPVLVEKSSGYVFETGSAYPSEHYVKAFENAGDPFAEPSNKIEIIEWNDGALAVNAIKSIRNANQCGLKTAKDVVDSVMEGNTRIIECKSNEIASSLVKELDSSGFRSRQLWSN